jgi:hypothetical protein
MFMFRSSGAKSLWRPNSAELSGISASFQRGFFETTFLSSNPTCPATQSVSVRREIARRPIETTGTSQSNPPPVYAVVCYLHWLLRYFAQQSDLVLHGRYLPIAFRFQSSQARASAASGHLIPGGAFFLGDVVDRAANPDRNCLQPGVRLGVDGASHGTLNVWTYHNVAVSTLVQPQLSQPLSG